MLDAQRAHISKAPQCHCQPNLSVELGFPGPKKKELMMTPKFLREEAPVANGSKTISSRLPPHQFHPRWVG